MADIQSAPLLDKPIEKQASAGTNGNSDTSNSSGLEQNHQQPLQHQMSTGSMGSPEPLPDDLSEDLLQMGWRKYWSKRENMPYYFNKITNESLWEMPQIIHVSGSLVLHRSVMLHFNFTLNCIVDVCKKKK